MVLTINRSLIVYKAKCVTCADSCGGTMRIALATLRRFAELSDQQCLSEEEEELREKLSLQKKTIDDALLVLELLCDA